MESGKIIVYLERWFSKPLKKLPDGIRVFVECNFPDWSKMTTEQRRISAEHKDVQLSTKWRLKIERAERQEKLFKESEEGKAVICIGWHDAELSAAMWFGVKSLAPREAAMLLCRQNPLDKSSDPLNVSTDETTPDDFNWLVRVFEDVATDGKPRRLTQWLSEAQCKGLKYHSWIDEYIAAVGEIDADLKSAQFQPSTADDSSGQADSGAVSSGRPDNAGLKNQGNSGVDRNDSTIIRKRKAFVQEVKNFWPTIESDLSDAARSKLSKSRVPSRHGYWDVTAALAWAAQSGKITKQKTEQFISYNPDSVFAATLKQLFK